MSEATAVSPDTIVIQVVSKITGSLQVWQGECQAFNDLPNIPWNYREEVRAIEGAMSKIEDRVLALLGRIGTPEAEEAMTDLWGPI